MPEVTRRVNLTYDGHAALEELLAVAGIAGRPLTSEEKRAIRSKHLHLHRLPDEPRAEAEESA